MDDFCFYTSHDLGTGSCLSQTLCYTLRTSLDEHVILLINFHILRKVIRLITLNFINNEKVLKITILFFSLIYFSVRINFSNSEKR